VGQCACACACASVACCIALYACQRSRVCVGKFGIVCARVLVCPGSVRDTCVCVRARARVWSAATRGATVDDGAVDDGRAVTAEPSVAPVAAIRRAVGSHAPRTVTESDPMNHGVRVYTVHTVIHRVRVYVCALAPVAAIRAVSAVDYTHRSLQRRSLQRRRQQRCRRRHCRRRQMAVLLQSCGSSPAVTHAAALLRPHGTSPAVTWPLSHCGHVDALPLRSRRRSHAVTYPLSCGHVAALLRSRGRSPAVT
jgi:hypothetical protein